MCSRGMCWSASIFEYLRSITEMEDANNYEVITDSEVLENNE